MITLTQVSSRARMYDDDQGHACVVLDPEPELGVYEPVVNLVIMVDDPMAAESMSYAMIEYRGWEEANEKLQHLPEDHKHWKPFMHAVQYYEKYHLGALKCS